MNRLSLLFLVLLALLLQPLAPMPGFAQDDDDETEIEIGGGDDDGYDEEEQRKKNAGLAGGGKEEDETPEAPKVKVSLQVQINEAIKKGVAWLKQRQEKGGTWGPVKANKKYGSDERGDFTRDPTGPTSFAIYTLAKCEVKKSDPVIKKGLRWLKERIGDLGGPKDHYRPTIHLDVHGALGQICENDLGRVLGQLYALELAAQPYPLRIECPVMMESRASQIETMKTLREYVRFRKMHVQLVVDEWANTLDDIRAFVDTQAADMIQIKMPDLGSVHNSVEAVLTCQAGNVGAFLGGSCAETDLSAKAAVHVALATRPDIIMAKPGMGVDEGVSLVQNEMTRTLAWIQARGA